MQRRKMQQRHRLKVLNAQGELEAVQKELDSHRQLLKKELATERRLEEELAAARRVLTAQSASQVRIVIGQLHQKLIP